MGVCEPCIGVADPACIGVRPESERIEEFPSLPPLQLFKTKHFTPVENSYHIRYIRITIEHRVEMHYYTFYTVFNTAV